MIIMSQIKFRGKIEQVYNGDGTLAYEDIACPIFTRSHCDMEWFRQSKAYGGLANSDLFPPLLLGLRRRLGVTDYSPRFRLDQLPDGVSVERGGFLATVRISVKDERV